MIRVDTIVCPDVTMTTNRRLLFLAPIVPAARGNGLAMRAGFFLDAYTRHFDVDLAVFPIVAAPESATDFLDARCRRWEIFPIPAVDTHFALVAATSDPSARLSAFRSYGLPSLAGRAGVVARQTLARWIGERRYDAVHVERLYLAPLAEQWLSSTASRPQLVIDCDDDDAATYRTLAAIERRYHRPLAAQWAEAEADAFASLARRTLARFDLAFAASAEGAKSLSRNGAQVSVVPNVMAANEDRARHRRARPTRTMLFVGTMGYSPNDDAARWLLTRIWPRLLRTVTLPLRLVIAGSNPSPALIQVGRQRGVLVTGTVADVAPFYRDADIAVIPVRAGGGTRIKLLEAAGRSVPIVSTTVGAEGTTFRHGRELLLADSEEGFAQACAKLLQHRERAGRLAARARRRVLRDYHPGRWAALVGGLVANACTTNDVALRKREELYAGRDDADRWP
jgi:glycosyltransferase involved in cell wall biosynthesis